MKNKLLKLLTASNNERLNNLLYASIILFLIIVITIIVYITGGTSSTVQLLYIPIFIAVFVFGIKEGIVTAIIAGIAVGPFMPKAVATNTMQPTSMWLLRIVISIVIVLTVGALSECIKKSYELEKKKAFEDINTGYYNFNKFKLDLNTHIINKKYTSISIIFFEFENMDMIRKYVDFEVSQKSYLNLLNMAKEMFAMGTIYAVTSSKFAVILPEYNLEETYDFAKKFIFKTKNPIYIEHLPISMVVKCGIVNYPYHDSDINSIIVKLGKSLDQCCKSHNEVAIYNNIIEEEQARYYSDLVSLYHALQNNMFILVYQPKIDIQNDKIIGVEALLRWNDSKHKNMSILELIKKAEDAGFINQITKWVIKNVAEQLKVWNQNGINTAVSINLSSRDLSDESFVNYVKNCITINEINPECIEFELTERSIIQDEKTAMEEIRKLKDMGIKISLDDYGTGFNSVKYLLDFASAFDYLKIDKIFIDSILVEENFIIVDCIIKAAHKLGIKVVAEGAETKEQTDILKSANCDIIQGYYYSKPLMPNELEKFMSKYQNKCLKLSLFG